MAKPAITNIPYTFPAAKFRNAIRFVFEMETDPDSENALTFHFESTSTYTGYQDGERVPFDPNAVPTITTPASVSVPCDVQFTSGADLPTAFGSVVASRVKVLLLDEDYELVKDAAYVVVNGDRYDRFYLPPSSGLFDVGLHEMVFQAANET